MSALKDKSKNKDEDNSRINQDAGNQIIDAISEGKVGSDFLNTDIIGAISENMPHSASNVTSKDINRQSGDSPDEVLQKNTVESDKTETHITDKSVKTDSGKGSGDYIVKTKVSMEADSKNDDFKGASTSLEVIGVKTDKSNSLIAKYDIIEPKTGDSKDKLVDEFTDDDDMELRWDDDDGNNQVTDDNEKSGKLEDILSEEEFFDEIDMNAENPRSNPEGNILVEKTNLKVKPGIDTEDILSEEEFLEETDMKAESAKTIPNKDTIAEKSNLKEKSGNDKLEDILSEEEFLEETDMKVEISETVKEILAEKSKDNKDILGGFKHSKESKVNTEMKPKMDIPLDQIAVDNINAETSESHSELNQEKDEVIFGRNKLLKEPEMNTESFKISPVVDIALEQSVGSKNADTTKSNPDILTEKSKEKVENILGGEKLFKEIHTEALKITSDIEISSEKSVDENILEANLLKKTETSLEKKIPIEKSEINENILKNNNVSEESENKTEKDIAKAYDVEEIDSTELDEKLLEETETNVTISEIIADTNLMNEETILEEEPKTIAKTTDISETDDAIKTDVVEDKGILEDKLSENTEITQTSKVLEMDVSMEKNDSKEELLRDDQNDSRTAMDVDNSDQSIDDQTKIEEKNKDQLIDDANKTEQTLNSLTKIDTQTDSISLDVQIKDKPKTDKLITETITEDVTPLNISNVSKQMSTDTVSICLEDSPVRIKTDHGLHKPDVMLEIPTQELIDMDDTDLSMNLEESEEIDSQTNVEKMMCEKVEIINEKTVVRELTVTESTVDKVLTDDTSIANDEKSTVNVKKTVENVDKVTFDEVTENVVKVIENVHKDIGNVEKSTENIDKGTDNVDKGTDNVDKGIEDVDKSIENVEKKTKDLEKYIDNVEKGTEHIDKSTKNVKKSIENVDIGIENVQKSTENDDKGTDRVDKMVKETIEESLERMFTEDVPTTAKEVAECKATTSQAPDVIPTTPNEMTPDTSDELPEVSDSLGLLAESSGRVMEDDEEPEDDDDGDDDDDFDQDESSNLPSAEQSEDSNHTPSETEPARDLDEKKIDTPDIKDEFQFTICNIESESQDKLDKTVMDIEVEEEKVEMPAQAAIDEETRTAVDALLKDVEGPSKEDNEGSTGQQMDIETVKLSDTDTEAEDKEAIQEDKTVSKQSKETGDKAKSSPSKQSPNKQLLITQSQKNQSPMKMKKLEITTMEASAVVNIVDLEESSSSEDDIQEVIKQPDLKPEDKPTASDLDGVTNVNIPTSIEIMCTSGGSTSEMVTKEGEVVISGIPKPPPHKPARLNTSEVSIKTVSVEAPLILETLLTENTQTKPPSKPKLSLEIFSLDSDDDDSAAKEKPAVTSPIKPAVVEEEKAPEVNKCINHFCTSGSKDVYVVADAAALAYYDAGRKRRAMVCLPCAEVLADRTKKLVQGIKDMTPLLDLDMGKLAQDLVEISDSESEDEDMSPDEPKESIGEKGAKLLEDNLAALMNETWRKYELDVRLRETQIMLDDEIEKLEQDSKEIDAMLNECQIATDKLRCELYATFEIRREETPALSIIDTPENSYIGPEVVEATAPPAASVETVRAKRRMSSASEKPAKRPAIPLGYAPLDADTSQSAKEAKPIAPVIDTKMDDDKDISVVKLSAEAAPADLPPPGELSRPPLRVSLPVYAMKNAFGPWLKGRILEVQPKNVNSPNSFSVCRVKFDHKTKTNGKVLPARCVAYAEPADVRMTIGTRLIALFKDSNKRESYYSGVVAEIPNPVNNYRYLVFFDDGYAQYVQHSYTRLVCESSPLVWEEVHPFSREFVREYLLAYPERPMVRLHEGQHLKTEWNGKWWPSRVTRVDASLAQVSFVGDGRREWIYRGSTRLAPLYLELRAAERHRPRPMPRSKAQPRFNMPYVEYTRSDEPETSKAPDTEAQQQNEEIRRQRAVAKKSTTAPPPLAPPPQQLPAAPGSLDTVTSRVVYYTPKNAVKPYKMTPHKCGPKCKRSDVLSLKELRTYNPLAKPLLSGWERQIVRYKGHKEVMYRAPCGRRVRGLRELHAYLRAVGSDLPVDLFDFHHATHCLAEFVLNKCLVGKKDLSHGKENVPVPCVNYYDDSLPEFCSYNTERTPTAGVPLNLDPEFLCGCDCTDDCQDKTKCACWKMTLEGARTIGLRGPNMGYVYKRLPEPLPSGIYECNSRCKCKHTCLNRVAQHPLQLKLQVFKTLNRGWGIRALNDVPKGSFLCVYAGNLLTDATANLDGLNEGDEYLAELDYIEVVEQMKEGFEEDIPEADKKLDKKEAAKDDDDEEDEPSSSEEEDTASKTDKEDDDFRPGYIGLGVTEFNKRLRRREKCKKEKEVKPVDEKEKEGKETNAEEDCITISDDEEVREPSRFMVQAGMGANEFISKYKSVRTLFGRDEACYIMDAKVQGNIGRYLNHSCCPNVFVQNVFVDTHDPRFPWVAFFALSHIKAGTELTWNYNYDVSVTVKGQTVSVTEKATRGG